MRESYEPRQKLTIGRLKNQRRRLGWPSFMITKDVVFTDVHPFRRIKCAIFVDLGERGRFEAEACQKGSWTMYHECHTLALRILLTFPLISSPLVAVGRHLSKDEQ